MSLGKRKNKNSYILAEALGYVGENNSGCSNKNSERDVSLLSSDPPWDVSLLSSDPPCKDVDARFTTVPLKALSDQI